MDDDAESRIPGGSPDEPVLSVGALTHQIKGLLEAGFPAVWVEGEISNLARPRSGHLYLTLKDADAALKGVMFRFAASRLSFEPKEGEQVLAFGQITVYPPRGDYQLKVTRMVPRGMGALQAAFEKLRARLEAEGLFAEDRKRPLPFLPRRIGVVTSATGAAVHDILRVLARRFPDVDVVLAPTRVQGPSAADEVAAALDRIQEVEGIEVVIVGRGGGSLEDLWAFNEEVVARAIFRSRLPVISAVGHEVDVTIADLVADVRAPTPSAAAEIVIPERRELVAAVEDRVRRGLRATRLRLRREGEHLRRLMGARVYRDPFVLLETRAQRVDELLGRIQRSLTHRLERARDALEARRARLMAVGPRKVMERGYAVLTPEAGGAPVTDTRQVEPGATLVARLYAGRLTARVTAVTDADGTTRVADEEAEPQRPRRARRRRRSKTHDEDQRRLFPEGERPEETPSPPNVE